MFSWENVTHIKMPEQRHTVKLKHKSDRDAISGISVIAIEMMRSTDYFGGLHLDTCRFKLLFFVKLRRKFNCVTLKIYIHIQ